MTKPFTMKEAAAILELSYSAFGRLVLKHPFYYSNGRRKLFTHEDIVKLYRTLNPRATVHEVRAWKRNWQAETTPYSQPAIEGDTSWIIQLGIQSAKRAAKAGLDYELSHIDLERIARRSRGRCELSGIPFDLTIFGNGKRNPFRPSLDRINNRLGYIPKNVRAVCSIANFAMNEWGEEPLRTFVLHMAEKLGEANDEATHLYQS